MCKIKYISVFALFAGVIAAGTGCTKKGQTASIEQESRSVGYAQPAVLPIFVTGNDQPADQPSPSELPSKYEYETQPVETPRETITPVVFAAKETEHVRIVDYDPFCDASDLVIDLDDLKHHFCYPYSGNRISNYGMRGRAMHTGVDIKTMPNDTIRAVLGGVVRMSKLYSSYGNIVVIRHPCGLETAYAHNSKNLVRPNDVVRAGDPIALAGRTGRATTEHLHFETRIAGEHFDPNLILDTQNQRIRGGKLYLKRQNGRILASASGYTPQPTAQASTASRNASPSNVDPAQAPEIYSVQRGDTLYSISRRYGLTVDRLCSMNGISESSVLSIGQRLKLK